MTEFRISFSRYDYIAIIIPGFMLLLVILINLSSTLFGQVTTFLSGYNNLLTIWTVIGSIAFIIISYVLGLILSFCSGFVIENLIIAKKLGFPSKNGFSKQSSNKIFSEYRKPYSVKFQNAMKTAFQTTFYEEFSDYKEGFGLVHALMKEHSPMTFGRLETFISLYGLFRNLSCTFLAIIPFLIMYFVQPLNIGAIIVTILLNLAFSFVSFLGFLKYYRIFTDELFKSFVVYSIEQKQRRLLK